MTITYCDGCLKSNQPMTQDEVKLGYRKLDLCKDCCTKLTRIMENHEWKLGEDQTK